MRIHGAVPNRFIVTFQRIDFKQESWSDVGMKKQKFWLQSTLAVTLLAVLTHAYLALQSYRLKSGFLDGKSFCNINSQFNCDAVALSSYSELFGIPVAVWGAATNLILLVFLLVLMLNLSAERDRLARVAFWLSGLIFLASIVMGTISVTRLGTYCLFCIAIYVFSLLQLLGALKINEGNPLPRLFEDIAASFRSQRWIPVTLASIPVIAILTNGIAKDAYGLKQADWVTQEAISFWKTSPEQIFKLEEGLSYQAHAGESKMQIVEFADFLCPHCKTASTPLHTFTEGHSGVRLVFKPFPLDGTCNAAIQQKGDGFRCKLAAASLCAESLNQRGWAVHDWIFERQSELSPSKWGNDLKEVAQVAGVPEEKLLSCIEDGATKDLLLRISEEGARAKILGTPTIFVNGRRLDRGQDVLVLDAVYRSL